MLQRAAVTVPAILLGRMMAEQLLLLGLFRGIRKQFMRRVHLARLVARPGAPSLPRARAAFLPLFEELGCARDHVCCYLRVVASNARR